MYKVINNSNQVVAICSNYQDALAMVNTNLDGQLRILRERG